jgi:uncharacterized protein YecT (DUF1311 family)
MRIVMVVCVAIYSGILFGQEPNCKHPVSMADMSSCGHHDLQVAEAIMLRVYQQTLAAFQAHENSEQGFPSSQDFDERVSRRLRESQADWFRYRQSFCSALEESFEGGSDASIAVPNCETDLTKNRTEELKKWFGDWTQTTVLKEQPPHKPDLNISPSQKN